MPIRRRAVLDRTQRLSALAVAGAVLGPAAVACGPAGGQPAGEPGAGSQPGQAVKGGTVTFGNFADGATLQPLLIQDTASQRLRSSAHYNAPLLRYEPRHAGPRYEVRHGGVVPAVT